MSISHVGCSHATKHIEEALGWTQCSTDLVVICETACLDQLVVSPQQKVGLHGCLLRSSLGDFSFFVVATPLSRAESTDSKDEFGWLVSWDVGMCSCF